MVQGALAGGTGRRVDVVPLHLESSADPGPMSISRLRESMLAHLAAAHPQAQGLLRDGGDSANTATDRQGRISLRRVARPQVQPKTFRRTGKSFGFRGGRAACYRGHQPRWASRSDFAVGVPTKSGLRSIGYPTGRAQRLSQRAFRLFT